MGGAFVRFLCAVTLFLIGAVYVVFFGRTYFENLDRNDWNTVNGFWTLFFMLLPAGIGQHIYAAERSYLTSVLLFLAGLACISVTAALCTFALMAIGSSFDVANEHVFWTLVGAVAVPTLIVWVFVRYKILDRFF